MKSILLNQLEEMLLADNMYAIYSKEKIFTKNMTIKGRDIYSTFIIVKKKNKISRDLLSKIEWACSLNSIKFEHQMILQGCLRIIEHTNLAYVESHRVIINNN